MSAAAKPIPQSGKLAVPQYPPTIQEHLHKALQMAMAPVQPEDVESAMACMARLIGAALTELATIAPTGIAIEVDWQGGPYTVVGRYRKVAGQSLSYDECVAIAHRLKDQLKASGITPVITLQTHRGSFAAQRGD